MKSHPRPVSSVSLLVDQLQKSCLHDQADFVGLAKPGYRCSSPSHTNGLLNKTLTPDSNLCFQYDTVAPRAVHFQEAFTPRSCGESPGYSDQDEHAHSPVWHRPRKDQQRQEDQPLSSHLHPQQEEAEEEASRQDDLEADHLRQYSTSAPVCGFNCRARMPSPYSPASTAANWAHSPVSSPSTAIPQTGHLAQRTDPYYPLSKRACRSSACNTTNSRSRRADGHGLCLPANCHATSAGFLMAAHMQTLPRPIAVRLPGHSRESNSSLRTSQTSSSRWTRAANLPTLSSSFPPGSQMNNSNSVAHLPPSNPAAVTRQETVVPGAPFDKVGSSVVAADGCGQGNSRPSAFTPTRPIVSRQRPDALHLSNCSSSFSPDRTDSVSSLLHQPQLLTPSSGFHENSFSYLSAESSSLPDCSNWNVFKLMSGCRHSEAADDRSSCCSRNQTMVLDTGYAANATLPLTGSVLQVDVMCGAGSTRLGDDCVFSPTLCRCRGYELPGFADAEDFYQDVTLSRSTNCSTCPTTRSLGKGSGAAGYSHQLLASGGNGLKRRRGPCSTADFSDRYEGEAPGCLNQSEGEDRMLEANSPTPALHQSLYPQTTTSSAGEDQPLDPLCTFLSGSGDPTVLAADPHRLCANHCHQSPASTVVQLTPLHPHGGGEGPAACGEAERGLDSDLPTSAVACRHVYSLLDGLREEENEEEFSEQSLPHQQKTPDTLTGEDNSQVCDCGSGWQWCHRQHLCQCACGRPADSSLSPEMVSQLAFTPIHTPSQEEGGADSGDPDCALEVELAGVGRCGSATSDTMSSPQPFTRRSLPAVSIADIDLNLIEND